MWFLQLWSQELSNPFFPIHKQGQLREEIGKGIPWQRQHPQGDEPTIPVEQRISLQL